MIKHQNCQRGHWFNTDHHYMPGEYYLDYTYIIYEITLWEIPEKAYHLCCRKDILEWLTMLLTSLE